MNFLHLLLEKTKIKKLSLRNGSLFFLLILFFIFYIEEKSIAKQNSIKLTSYEKEPYIGSNLKNNGYVSELIVEAFKRVGYNTSIDFYPLDKAKSLAKIGEVDGFFPSDASKSLNNVYVYSNPLPGDNIILLKKKSLKINYQINPRSLKKSLEALKKYEFGVVKGFTFSPDFDTAKFLNKQYAANDLQNIDKLMHNRIDFIVIDKLIATDIIIKQRPNYIGQLEVIRRSLANNLFHIAFSKNNKKYKQTQIDFNRGLKMITDDGTLEKILESHGLFSNKESSNEKIKLTIGTVSNIHILAMQRLSKDYEQNHPQIKLEWKIMDENTLRQRLLSDLLFSDGQFDILSIGAYETPIWGKNQWIIPIKNLPKSYNLSDILKPIYDTLSYQNNLYALPFYGESSMLFYRKDLFKKSGISMPKNPTYDDIFKFAKAIHDPSHNLYAICLRGVPGWGSNIAYFSTLVNTLGGRWFDEKWDTTIDTPEWHKAVKIYKDLLTQYGSPKPTEKNYGENFELFKEGHCGMWIDATVFAGALMDPKISKVANKVGFTNSPIAVTPKGSHWLWTWALAISASSKHQNEALKFITWATSPKYIDLVAKTDGWLSIPPGTRRSIYKNKEYRKQAPFADEVVQAIESANPNDQTLLPRPYSGIQFVAIPEFPAFGIKIGGLLANVISDKISADTALKEAQEFISEQMRASKYTK
jgi:sorbitol/mannitol transport system substrate-binding protein